MRLRINIFFAPGIAAIAALAAGQMLSSPAFADPSTLHTGLGVGSTCTTGGNISGCTYIYENKELHGIDGTEADIYLNDNGIKTTLNDPFDVILGIPNISDPMVDQFKTSDPITSAVVYTSGGTAEEDLTPSAGTSKYKVMTGSDAYTLLGLGAYANNSQNWSNWTGAESAVNGITATNFGLYEFQLSHGTCLKTPPATCDGIDFEGDELINLQFSSLPVGTFVFGFGSQGSGKSYTGFSNPFTETGMVIHKVPEPDSLALCALGLAALGFGLRRKAPNA